jgi:hypothetical protein
VYYNFGRVHDSRLELVVLADLRGDEQMRVNVYSEEITERVELVEKTVGDTGETFYGVRFFLASPAELHRKDQGDDDAPSVTFWGDRPDRDMVRKILSKALDKISG